MGRLARCMADIHMQLQLYNLYLMHLSTFERMYGTVHHGDLSKIYCSLVLSSWFIPHTGEDSSPMLQHILKHCEKKLCTNNLFSFW